MGLIPVLPVGIEIVIVVMAVIYTAVSIAAQRLLTNPKRMRQIQAKVQILQKEMNEMMKNKAPNEQLMQKQKEFMPLMGEQMKGSMKPMLVIFPLLLLTYYYIIPNLPMVTSSYVGSSKYLFFIIVFIVGTIAAVIIMIYDRKKMKEEMREIEAAEPAQPSLQR